MSDGLLGLVIDSADASVGGGSASALAGAMAAGLVGMVARLSTNRRFGLGDQEYLAAADETDELGRALLAGALEDADAYGLIKVAYGLPKDGDTALAARRAAIEKALEVAADVPLENARRSLRVREIWAALSGSTNPAADSDFGVAALLADAAIRGCLLNVEVNMVLLPDSPAATRLRQQTAVLRSGHELVSAAGKETV